MAQILLTNKLFYALNGFVDNTKIASGDDVFLIEKALKDNPKSVLYLKSESALVNTKPQLTFKGLIQQRLRWGC